MKKNKVQPNKVKRIVCPRCGELQVKIYPYSSFVLADGNPIPPCRKCINNSSLKAGVA